MNIDEALRALCVKHGLTAVSVHMNAEHGVRAHAHWDDNDGSGIVVMRCVLGSGKTCAEAIVDAITLANEARAIVPDVPALEIGEIAA